MGYQSRLPDSNDPPHLENKLWGGDELFDDFALLVNGLAKRYSICQRAVRTKFQTIINSKVFCPDDAPSEVT